MKHKPWERIIIAAAIALAGLSPIAARNQELIFENGKKGQLARTDEAFELRAGPGWIRIPHVFGAFELRFEFQLTTPLSAGTVEMRTWPETGGHPRQYAFSLAGAAGAGPGAPLLTGPEAAARAIRSGERHTLPVTDWHKVVLRREGGELTVILNDVFAGVYETDQDPATLLLRTSAAAMKLRRMTVATPAPPSKTLWDVLPHFERQRGITGPEVTHEEKPPYTSHAMRRRVEGVVLLEAIILNDGSVGDVRVLRSLDVQLDQQAVSAVNRWKFKPARREGRPIPIVVSIESSFCLRC